MKPITFEWVQKAEEDWHVGQMSYRSRKYPSYDAACFHAQQCAEKYLKGRLEEAGIAFPKTHDLIKLLSLVIAVEPLWAALQPLIAPLTPYAVTYRYPGFTTTKPVAKAALNSCKVVRRVVRTALGLPV